MENIKGLKESISALEERLGKEFLDSRREELRRHISVLEESLEAERRAIEERQGELF